MPVEIKPSGISEVRLTNDINGGGRPVVVSRHSAANFAVDMDEYRQVVSPKSLREFGEALIRMSEGE